MKKILATILAAAFGLGAWALTGDGTPASPYQIANATDLAAMRDMVNNGTADGKCWQLTANVDLNNVTWTPIGTAAHPFSGVFDGDNKTISNFTLSGAGAGIPIALFGYIKGTESSSFNYNTALSSFYDANYTVTLPSEDVFGCEVKNLNVSGVTANTTADGWTAAAVAYCDNATVKNVRVSNSTVTADEKVGGVVAFVPNNAAALIIGCSTASDVTVTASTGNHAAGILARVNGTSSRVIISGCENNATISCAGVNGSGITGQAKYTLIHNCTNNGSVTGNTRTAGIATDTNNSVIIGCTNNGAITSNGSGNAAGASTAGIDAYSENVSDVIVNCTNTGSVTANCTGDAIVAGVVGGGVVEGVVVVQGCSNTGTLTNVAAGGVVYDVSKLSGVETSVAPADLAALNAELAKPNKNVRVTSGLTLPENACTIVPTAQEIITFDNGVGYLTIDLSSITTSNLKVNVCNTSIKVVGNTAKADLALSIIGSGNTITYDTGNSLDLKQLYVQDDTGTSAVEVNAALKQLTLAGTGTVNATVTAGTTIDKVGFATAGGTYTLTNNGTISHTQSAANASANEHTVSTIKAATITINNYGTIESKKNANDVSSYALLFYGGSTAVINCFDGSLISCEQSGRLLVCGSANSVTFNVQDGASFQNGASTAVPTSHDNVIVNVMADPVAQIGTTKYPTLAEAVAAAQEGDTVTLLADTAVADTITINKSMTLDLNGKTITNTSTGKRPFYVVTEDPDSVVETADEDGNVVFEGATTLTVEGNGGSLVIPDGGTAYGFFDIAKPYTGIVINGGTISGDGGNGSLIRYGVDGGYAQQIALNNVTGITKSRMVSYAAAYYLWDIKVIGGTYTHNNYRNYNGAYLKNAFEFFTQNGIFDGVTITSDEGSCVCCGGSYQKNMVFRNNTFTVNGKSTISDPWNNAAIAVQSAGSLTIESGTYTSAGIYGVATANSGATINIEGGTITGADYGVRIYGGGYDPDTTLNISGTASVTGGQAGVYVLEIGNGSGTATANINGGTIEGGITIANKTATPSRATVEIEDGEVSGTLTDASPSGKSGVYSVSGGVFSSQVPAEYCTADYSPVANTDPETSTAYPYTVASDYEAQIVRDGVVVTPKGTLTAMIAAAQAGDTVQLLKDVAIDSALTVEKSITLDLNGFGLEVPDNNNTPIFVNNDATTTLTIVNSNSSTPATLGDADTTKSQYLAKPFAGNIVIGAPNSGAITLTTENIFNQPSGAIGTVTINEGVTVTAGNLYIPAKATTINGGTFNGSVHFSGIENVVTINGGEFKGNVDANSSAAVSSISITGGDFTKNPSPADAPMTVSGGTFRWEIPLKAEYIADGCSVNVGNGNVYEVSTEALDTPAVEVTFEDGKKLYYSTLNSRIFTACDGATVKLLKDIALGATLGFGSNDPDNPSVVTLDLNGHVLSYGGNYDTLSVDPYATVTVRDTSASGNGKITNGFAEGDAVYLSGGASFVLESGTLEATGADSVGIYANSSAESISITGGAISAASGLIATNGGAVDVEISGGIFSHEPTAAHIVDGYAGGDNADAETSGSYPYVVGLLKVTDLAQQAGATETSATYAVTVVVVNDKGETIGTLPDPLTIEVSIAAADAAGSTLAKYDVSKVLDAALASGGLNVTKVEISVVISAPTSGEGTVSYEVHPEAVVTVTKDATNTTTTIPLTNACLAADASFTFDLDVTGVVAAGDWAKVTHVSADPKYAAEARNLKAVAGDGGKVYVTVTTTHFSTFTIGAGVPPVTFGVRSDNLFGSIKIEGNVASNLYVATLFEGFEADGALRKAQDVVHATNLTAGTKMYVYDKTADKYDVFEVDANGKWAAADKLTVDVEGKATFDTADLTRGVTNGTGVIVGRKNTAETVYVYGQVPKIPIASTTFGAGQTLVSPPYTNGVEYVDLNASTWTGVKATGKKRLKNLAGADYIQFRTADNRLVKYYYLEGEGWGVVPTQVSLFSEFVANGKALIPVGTAFWYYSNAGGATVEWK